MAVRLAIAGAGGRMGQALIDAALHDPAFALAAALDVPGSPARAATPASAVAARSACA